MRGLVACAEKGIPGEAYNLACGVETSIADLAKKISSLTGNPTPVDLRPARDWDRSGRRFGATEKSRAQIEFEAVTAIEEGLQRTIAWTLKNKVMIQKCMEQHALMLRQLDLSKETVR